MLRPTAMRPKTLPLSLEAAEDGKLRRTAWVGMETRHVTSTAGAWLSRIRRQTSAQIESCLFFQYFYHFLPSSMCMNLKIISFIFFQEIMFFVFQVSFAEF